MNKAVKTVGFMVAATMLAKIMGLLRGVILAQTYGESIQLDSFIAAGRIPLLFFDLTLGASIISTFIPVYNKYLQKGQTKQAADFANTFLNLMLLVSGFFCVVGILFSGPMAKLLIPGADEATKSLTGDLLVILLPTTVFTTLAYCFVGILQSHGEFNVPAIISLVSNSAVIAYLLLFNRRFGIYGLAAAMLVGWSLQALVQVPSLLKLRFRYRLRMDVRDEGIKSVFLLALPVLLSSWFQPVCVLVNTVFASYFQTGSVTAIELANNLYLIIVGVFAFAITNYVFPSLSKLSAGDGTGFAGTMTNSLRAMAVIIVPISAGMLLLSHELIEFTYQRNEFTQTLTALTASALFYYSLAMPAYGINEILNKCFYAMEDGKTPMRSSALGIGCVMLCSFLFSRLTGLGVGGLALGVSVSTWVVCAVLTGSMHRKTRAVFTRGMLLFGAKVLLAACVMAVGVSMAKQWVAPFGILIRLAVPVIVGAGIYFPVLLLCNVKFNLKKGRVG